MLSWLLLATLAIGGVSGPWRPPNNPDPRAILEQAASDTQNCQYEVALAKLTWFHRNALKYDRAQSGVRLSFALDYWYDLAQVYPPALDALTKARDEALQEVPRQGVDGIFEPFSDLEAIDKKLGEEERTVSAFKELDRVRPEVAARVFHVARPALIHAKAYRLCGKYLRPAEDWLMAAQVFQLGRRDNGSLGREFTEYSEKSFTNEVATLLALLVVNGRRQEAEKLAEKARLEWDSTAFHSAIASALDGVVPDPWP